MDDIEKAISAIARKAHIALNSDGSNKDSIYELALTAISALVGPTAVHNIEALKSQEALNKAVDLLAASVQ